MSIRRLSLGAGYRYLMESMAVGDGRPEQSSSLTHYYAESGTPPGVFLGSGLAHLGGGVGVEPGREVTDEHLYRMLGECADPLTGEPLGRRPNAKTLVGKAPVAGFDLTFSPSKSVSTVWALADQGTQAVIYDCLAWRPGLTLEHTVCHQQFYVPVFITVLLPGREPRVRLCRVRMGNVVESREVGRVWDSNAEAWTELSRAGFDVYRDLVNTPAFLAMLPDVSGQVGLDLGCGEGHNTALVAERAGWMVGLDISPRFARSALAAVRSVSGTTVVVGDGLALPFPNGSFDFVVGFMSFMDVPRPADVLAEAARVLRPGGFVQFSITHPWSNTPVRHWVYDEHGDRVALASGGYFDQKPSIESWLFSAAPAELRAQYRPFRVPRFPLTLAGWLNAVVDAGLVIERVNEPCATEETAAAHPEVADTRIAPYFLHIRARKPATASAHDEQRLA